MSDYTPPTLVIPTPGGNPGDGNLNGALTVLANVASPPRNKALQKVDSSGDPLFYVASDGRLLIGVDSESSSTGPFTGYQIGSGANSFVLRDFGVSGGPVMYAYGGVTTSGTGIPPIYGVDNRRGLTAADSAAKTLYTTTAAGQAYRLMGRILATAGTSPSATYTIKWTEGGATITKTLTISALDSDSDLSILIQPDNGTAITAQLTAISGTGTTVNVAATVEQMA